MANVMELMREYKHLKRLKKEAGMLTENDEARLRELTAYLQGALSSRKSKGPEEQPKRERKKREPKPAPAPAAEDPNKPMWQRQAEEDAARQARAQANFQIEVPTDLDDVGTPVAGAEEEEDQAGGPRNKKRKRPRNQQELEEQLDDVYGASTYEMTFDSIYAEAYYPHLNEGYSLAEEAVELDPIDPREVELQKAGLLSSTGAPEEGAQSVTKVPGGAFLDEFMVLYEKGVLPRPEDDDEPEIDDPNAMVPGKRKVTVHMLNGEVKRGTIGKIMQGAQGFTLNPQRGRPEEIAFATVKAVFIQKGPRTPDVQVEGKKLTVEFKDRRRIQGVSPDYQPGTQLFCLVPQGRGNFERVIVNVAAAARVG